MAKIEETKTQVSTTNEQPATQPVQPSQPMGRRREQPRQARGGFKGRGRGAKTPVIPTPGPVPQPGLEKTSNAPTPFSGTPVFDAWGPSPVQQNKRRIRQQVYIDAAGYEDLVEVEYTQLVAKHSASARKIPRSLFKYVCFMAWWHRAFFLKLANSNHVSQNEREAMRVLDSLAPNVSIPTRIKEYLKAMGNFDHVDGQRVEIKIPDFNLSSNPGDGDPRGFVTFDNNSRRTTPATSFIYGRYPIPGMIAACICREYDYNNSNNVTLRLDEIGPEPQHYSATTAVVNPTANIIGLDIPVFQELHASWTSTLADLGWQAGTANSLGVPPDTLSQWLISPSTLRWTSDTIKQIGNYPVSSLAEVNQNIGGAYIQLSYLSVTQILYEPIPNPADMDMVKGTLYPSTTLKSVKPIASSHLGPALACAYRKEILFSTYHGVANTTLSATWLPLTANNDLVSFTPATMNEANREFAFPGPLYNTDTYETAPVTRSLVLHSVLL
jgi:hypothetical protein